MKCQWGGNSLNKLLALFCFSKRILWISIFRCISCFILYNLLQREGRLKTRLFLHFSKGAISAATQIQLSARASLGYKIIKGFGMKASGVSLLPHDFIVISLISAFSTSSSLPSRKNHRVKIFQTKWHWRKDTQCCWSLCSHYEETWFCNFIFSRVGKHGTTRISWGRKRAKAQIPKPGDGLGSFLFSDIVVKYFVDYVIFL